MGYTPQIISHGLVFGFTAIIGFSMLYQLSLVEAKSWSGWGVDPWSRPRSA